MPLKIVWQMHPDIKRFAVTQMMWIGVSLAISLALSFILPFPISLVAMIGVFLFMTYILRKRQMRRMELARSGISAFGTSETVNYYCMNCGTKHNQSSCPHCGSRMKKAGF